MTLEDIKKSLEGALIVDRQIGPPNGGAAVVTVTFKTFDGGEEYFNLLERLLSGG